MSSLASCEYCEQAKGGYDGRTNWQLHRCMLFSASSRGLIIVDYGLFGFHVFFLFRFGFCFGFSGVCCCAGSCAKAESPP
jgi:hypothetical protein